MPKDKDNYGEYGRSISPIHQIDFEEMLEDKLERARDAMNSYGFGSILCLTPPNIKYVTNVPLLGGTAVGIGGNTYGLLPEDDTPICFYDCDGADVLENSMPPYVEIRKSIPPFGGPYFSSAPGAQEYLTEKFAEQISETLSALDLDKETVGIDTENPRIEKALEDQGLEVDARGGKAILEARTIKTYWEQQLIRLLTGILDGCFYKMAQTLEPGVSEQEVWAEVTGHAIKQGLTIDGGYISSGPHTWPKDTTRESTDRLIRPGDLVWADFFNWGCFGYRSCYYRTFFMGSAPEDVKETYQTMITWLRDGEKEVKPGATTKDVVEAWPDEIELYSDRPPYIKNETDALSTFFGNMGHGIGLTNYDPPFFWRPTSIKWPQELKAGMTISLETQAPTPDNQMGVRVEDQILVTEDGHEILSRWPADEIPEIPIL